MPIATQRTITGHSEPCLYGKGAYRGPLYFDMMANGHTQDTHIQCLNVIKTMLVKRSSDFPVYSVRLSVSDGQWDFNYLRQFIYSDRTKYEVLVSNENP